MFKPDDLRSDDEVTVDDPETTNQAIFPFLFMQSAIHQRWEVHLSACVIV